MSKPRAAATLEAQVRQLVREGHTRKEAIAIVLERARKAKKPVGEKRKPPDRSKNRKHTYTYRKENAEQEAYEAHMRALNRVQW